MRRFKRATFAILALLLALHLAGTSRAHDGPHGPDMIADVMSAEVEGHSVHVALNVINLGGPLVLTGFSATGAGDVTFAPVYLNFAEDVAVSARLDFSAPPPASFVLHLNFAVVGQGAVEVNLGPRGPASHP